MRTMGMIRFGCTLGRVRGTSACDIKGMVPVTIVSHRVSQKLALT